MSVNFFANKQFYFIKSKQNRMGILLLKMWNNGVNQKKLWYTVTINQKEHVGT